MPHNAFIPPFTSLQAASSSVVSGVGSAASVKVLFVVLQQPIKMAVVNKMVDKNFIFFILSVVIFHKDSHIFSYPKSGLRHQNHYQ